MSAVIAACVALALLAPAASAQEATRSVEPPSIVTIGEGVVRRAPDLAFVTLAVESRARSPRDAQQQNATTMAAVVKKLGDAGIPKDALRTIGLRLDQEFDNISGRRVPREFVARNTLEVRLDDIARAGEIADMGVQAGATSLDSITFDVKDRAGAEREAIRLAVADARARADAAAAGAGRTIDRILKIEEQGGRVVQPRTAGMFTAAAERAVTPVEPGLIEIRASVVLTSAMR